MIRLAASAPPAQPGHRVGVRIDGRGPKVVLLHSSMSSKSQWRRLVDSLRDTHRLITIDLYGYGETQWPGAADGFSLADEVSLVESVLARELPAGAGECFHLVGHSYGGAVALRLAQANPSRVRSLCLFEPGAFHVLPGGGARAELEALRHDIRMSLAEDDPLRGARRFIDYWNGPGSFDRLSVRRQDSLSRLLPKTALEFRGVERERLDFAACRRLRMPTLLMGGQHSPQVAHTVLTFLSDLLPRSECRYVAAGHMAPVTHPELVNPIIAGFVRALDAAQFKAA